MSRLTKGDPSRRLFRVSVNKYPQALEPLLVEEHFAMLPSSHGGIAYSTHAGPIRSRALEESTIPPDHIAHTVLCRAIELCGRC